MFKNFKRPISNSIFVKEYNQVMFWRSDYKFYDTVRRFRFHIIEPLLDQPPLGMLITAIPAKLFGFTDFTQIPQIIVFFPAIFASVFSLFFIFILAGQLFNLKIAYLSLIVYGLSPIYVFSHRQPYLENYITPLFLLGLILLHQYLKTNKKSLLLPVIFLLSICNWIKLTAFSLTAIVCFWLFRAKKYREVLTTLFVSLSSLLLYFLYGVLINKNHFFHTLSIQGNRGMDINAFFRIFTNPEFYQQFPDGIYLLGLISIFSLFVFHTAARRKNKNIDFFLLNFIFLLIVILITTGKKNNFFWYRFPLYPFFSIAIAIFIDKLLKNNNIFLFLPVLILGFFGIDAAGIKLPFFYLRLFYLLTLTIFFIRYLVPKKKLPQLICYYLVRIILVIILLLNALAVIKYPIINCYQANCPMPNKIVVN